MKQKSLEETLSEILRWLKQRHGISCTNKEIRWGHKCKTVFHGQRKKQRLVIKIGLTAEAKQEVLMNQKGYRNIRIIGASAYLPRPCTMVKFGDIPILIMQDCGENLFEKIRKSKDPKAIFDELVRELSSLYGVTTKKRQIQKVHQSLSLVSSVLEKQFHKFLYLYEPFTENEHSLEKVRRLLSTIPVSSGCFACWDFTPEDVFLAPSGLIIIDPPEITFGLPIIDMACFAGVSRDVYKLPGSKYGYKKLKALSLKVGKMLGLTRKDSEFIFLVGRTLQCSLSSRFRIGEDTFLSKKFYRMAKDFLLKCTS